MGSLIGNNSVYYFEFIPKIILNVQKKYKIKKIIDRFAGKYHLKIIES